MKRIFTLILMALLFAGSANAAKDKSYSLASPDGKTVISVETGSRLTWSVTYNNQTVIVPSAISITVDGVAYGPAAKVVKTSTNTQKGKKKTPFYKAESIDYSYSELDIRFKDDFGVIFRAYNGEGVAYRFYSTSLNGGEKVNAEQAEFNFDSNYPTYVGYTTGSGNLFKTNFQNLYSLETLDDFNVKSIAFSPLLVRLNNGLNVEITESDIEAYPGMFLKKTEGCEHSLCGEFAKVPSKLSVDKTRGEEIVAEYSEDVAVIRIASSAKQPRFFPWRILAIEETDADLLTNNIVALTASECRVKNFDWVRPGKIAWDWWNDWNIAGVDFRAGINTETYKYYIDFAAANGIEYVVLDEGWSNNLDMMVLVPEIDLKAIVDYAASKKVGIVLWGVAYLLDSNLEAICQKYSEMGVKGFKIDFINRDDQFAVERLYRINEACAKYHLMLDYHGMYKPAGMNHTYPNVINFEGVYGLEEVKWIKPDKDMVTYDVTFPFIRQLSGPVDYTQGAMRNANKKQYMPSNTLPMSQGTRSRQVAEYVIFDSPFEMLCDTPTNYIKEQETTSYIAQIPTVWDETVVLDAKIGEYIVEARRSGKTWYVGGLTNWDARDITVNLNFFKGTKTVSLFRDGINADRNATDYKLEKLKANPGDAIKVHMAPGGGFAMIIK